MIDPWLFAKSVSVGIAVAVPVGPMSVLCMQRTLRQGRGQGLIFGAGIAAADFTYALLGAVGLSALSALLLAGSDWLRIAGAFVLLGFAVHILRQCPAEAPNVSPTSAWRGFASAYLLTLANPPTILFFAGLFASVAPLSNGSNVGVFAVGVFTGSLLWWILLTYVVTRSAGKLSQVVLGWINRAAGVVLIGFALYALAESFV